MGKSFSAADAGAVCAIMRAETLLGADEEFETLMREFSTNVLSEEPGCSSYVVTRAMGSRQHFAVHAAFSDWRAFEDHAETGHLARALTRLSPLLASPISMEIFVAV